MEEENVNQSSPQNEENVNEPASENEEKVSTNVAEFEEFNDSKKKSENPDKLDMLKDLQLNVYIELGRTQMQVKDILELERGYVIELDKLASEPVDIFVNNKKIAEGEVVVIDKHFGIRITYLNDPGRGLKGIYK